MEKKTLQKKRIPFSHVLNALLDRDDSSSLFLSLMELKCLLKVNEPPESLAFAWEYSHHVH